MLSDHVINPLIFLTWSIRRSLTPHMVSPVGFHCCYMLSKQSESLLVLSAVLTLLPTCLTSHTRVPIRIRFITKLQCLGAPPTSSHTTYLDQTNLSLQSMHLRRLTAELYMLNRILQNRVQMYPTFNATFHKLELEWYNWKTKTITLMLSYLLRLVNHIRF